MDVAPAAASTAAIRLRCSAGAATKVQTPLSTFGFICRTIFDDLQQILRRLRRGDHDAAAGLVLIEKLVAEPSFRGRAVLVMRITQYLSFGISLRPFHTEESLGEILMPFRLGGVRGSSQR
jgi:hypothetical protein